MLCRRSTISVGLSPDEGRARRLAMESMAGAPGGDKEDGGVEDAEDAASTLGGAGGSSSDMLKRRVQPRPPG